MAWWKSAAGKRKKASSRKVQQGGPCRTYNACRAGWDAAEGRMSFISWQGTYDTAHSNNRGIFNDHRSITARGLGWGCTKEGGCEASTVFLSCHLSKNRIYLQRSPTPRSLNALDSLNSPFSPYIPISLTSPPLPTPLASNPQHIHYHQPFDHVAEVLKF